jgi:YD repeat-containing protein
MSEVTRILPASNRTTSAFDGDGNLVSITDPTAMGCNTFSMRARLAKSEDCVPIRPDIAAKEKESAHDAFHRQRRL